MVIARRGWTAPFAFLLIACANGRAAPPSVQQGNSRVAGLADAATTNPALATTTVIAAPAPLATATPTPTSSTPFGPPVAIARYTCSVLPRGGPFRSFLAAADMATAFVDGDDWLALVNRSPTGALPPDYAPTDLVDLRDRSARKPSACEGGRECLRSDAAVALDHMLRAMSDEGIPARIQSAFRGFGTQCWVFAGWARQARGGFCEATAQSALPGHSQHQLGTTLDLFTKEWAEEGAKSGQGVFRNGFGCTRGGKWLDETAWTFGFVVSYPIHPDDRKEGSRCLARTDRPVPIDPKTGYKNEPWHLRFIGVDAAAKFHEAWQASVPGTPGEITLEQWLRAERGLVGDAELPVCDGCQCGACSTLSTDDAKSPCGKAALVLDSQGRVLAPAEEPRLTSARATPGEGGLWAIDVDVHAPPHTPTQTPVLGPQAPAYARGATFEAWVPYADAPTHAYPDLPGAFRVAIEASPPTTTRWPWRASLAAPDLGATWNRANVVLPAKAGDSVVRVVVSLPEGTESLRVTLLREGIPHGDIGVPLAP